MPGDSTSGNLFSSKRRQIRRLQICCRFRKYHWDSRFYHRSYCCSGCILEWIPSVANRTLSALGCWEQCAAIFLLAFYRLLPLLTPLRPRFASYCFA